MNNVMKHKKKEHILACLSSAPSNAKIIRTAARMAKAFNGQFTALFVETPGFSVTPANKLRLQENQKLAEQLGANIEIVYGEDVPYQIAEFARLSGVTTIVLGRSVVATSAIRRKTSLTEQLISYAPEIDIHIIPDKSVQNQYHPQNQIRPSWIGIAKNLAKSIGILTGATLLGSLFYHLGFTAANIIMVYILGVLLTSIATSHLIYSLVSSVASVFIFNYYFITPRFSFAAYDTGYPITFIVMFLTAFITGTFAIQYKAQAGQSAKIAYRTKILFDTSQLLSKAENKEEILTTAAEQIVKLSNRNIVIFENQGGELSEPQFFLTGKSENSHYNLKAEKEIAQWVLEHNHSAGAHTDILSDTKYRYFALRVNERVYGVIGVEVKENPMDAFEHEIFLSILGECALALENEKNAREKEAAAVLAENEQLRANLLRTISHDLRTPLTTISGNISNLMNNGAAFDEEIKQQLYQDIHDDSMWLINLVENLLSATRIEDGQMTLRTSTELLSDIVEEVLNHVKRKTMSHRILVVSADELLLVKADVKLIVQVLLNIVDNAVKYTPPNSDVIIETRKQNNMAEILVSDNGTGISDEEKCLIFDMFYCGKNNVADNRRSIGLGLYLCKAIVEAHGGKIYVRDNYPKGTVFGFTLPLEEVTLNE